MKKIYERANWIMAWLGPSTPGTDLAIQKIKEWDAYYKGLQEAPDSNRDTVKADITPRNVLICGPPGSPAYEGWLAIQELCKRSWWSRVWIIPEATTPMPVRVHCGEDYFLLDQIFSINSIADELATHRGHHIVRHFDRGESIQLLALQYGRSIGSTPAFLQVLQLFRRCGCTDPRDRVYAALSVVSDSVKVDIVPDYSKALENVYLDVPTWVLSHYPEGHRLDFLGYVLRSGDETQSSMPTWVPDWRTSMVGDNPPPLFHQNYQSHSETHQGAKRDRKDPRPSAKYKTATGLSTFAMISGSILIVKGFCFDFVQEISSTSEDELTLPGTLLPYDGLKEPYPTGEVKTDVFEAVYAADVLRVSRSRYHVRANFARETPEETEGPKPHNRAFFLTTRGYMGIGSSAIKCGDSVMILHGGQVPYILRARNRDESEFICECYVHGLMFGEALQFEGKEGYESKLWNIV